LSVGLIKAHSSQSWRSCSKTTLRGDTPVALRPRSGDVDLKEGKKLKEEEIKRVVRDGYAEIAGKGCGCGVGESPCCGAPDTTHKIGRGIGYTDEELQSAPEGSNLGLGCGNPLALLELKEGDTVLDLGSGAGFDCFLAAEKVGGNGRVIGVDMTPEMLIKARENARSGGFENVEFRLGEIEHLPVADGSVDVIISNCVINLAPDKSAVFSEAFRALEPGGRLMVSDIVLLAELPDAVRNSISAVVGCLAGAVMKEEYLGAVRDAGFEDVEVLQERTFPVGFNPDDPTATGIIKDPDVTGEDMSRAVASVISVSVRARKPRQ